MYTANKHQKKKKIEERNNIVTFFLLDSLVNSMSV